MWDQHKANGFIQYPIQLIILSMPNFQHLLLPQAITYIQEQIKKTKLISFESPSANLWDHYKVNGFIYFLCKIFSLLELSPAITYIETMLKPSTHHQQIKVKKRKEGIARSVPCSSWYQWQRQWSCRQRHKREDNQRGG